MFSLIFYFLYLRPENLSEQRNKKLCHSFVYYKLQDYLDNQKKQECVYGNSGKHECGRDAKHKRNQKSIP